MAFLFMALKNGGDPNWDGPPSVPPSVTFRPPKPSNRTTGKLHPVGLKVWSKELWGSDVQLVAGGFNPFAKDAQSSKLKHETPKFGVKIQDKCLKTTTQMSSVQLSSDQSNCDIPLYWLAHDGML